MKNKKVTYLLLASVAVVWGLIVYRIVLGLGDDTDSLAAPSAKKDIVVYSEKKEAYKLLLNYADPFLKGGRGISSGLTGGALSTNVYASSATRQPAKVTAKKEPKPVVAPVVIDWSFISYIGLIGNRNSAQKIGLLTVHAKEFVVKEKDVVDGVTVVRLTKDTLAVSYNSTKHLVVRNR